MDQYDTRIWRVSHILMWVVCCTAAASLGLGMPTGFGSFFDIGLFIFIGTVGMALCSVLISVLLTLLRVPIPRFFVGSTIYTGVVLYFILFYADLGINVSIELSAAIVIISSLLGCFVAWLTSCRVSIRMKLLVSSLMCAACLVFFILPPDKHSAESAVASIHDSDLPKSSENPAEPGSFAYQYFTYGSGDDRQRKEFAEGARLVSTSVNASDYITKWPWLRSLFWGFDETALPLNGRVWMPEGEGPFPLVVMVHGNHLMEKFSDEGYAYLGELLASRGFIAVSVDENFLNYSVWSGIPNQDMKVRAWMLLKHLQQMISFSEQTGTPFYHRIDYEHIALLGHSRGGQAVAMAADRTRWFSADQTLTSLDRIHIQAVIALAPTNKAVDQQYAALHNIDYLTLQGTKDADVNNYNGDRQYVRVTYSENSARFKASLSIANANHSQFNTEWGTLDVSMPGGIFLNRKGIMEAFAQRQVVKVYVSGFLEAAFHGKKEYIGLFRDYRSGLNWLPQSRFFCRFESGNFQELTRFDADNDRSTLKDGMTATAEGMTNWRLQETQVRQRNDKGTKGIMLEWKNNSSYTIYISNAYRYKVQWSSVTGLMFSMANMERDLDESNNRLFLPKVAVEVESHSGAVVRLLLDSIMPVQPLPRTIYTNIPWLLEKRMKGGKYKKDMEPVFQTYEIPFQRLKETNPDFSPVEITNVTFHFIGGPGKIMLDDIGWTQDTVSESL